MRKLAIAAALALASTAAFAQDVKTDFDKDANFAAIKTFPVKIGTSWNNPISEKRVLDEIKQALTEKGWKSGRRGQGRRARAAPRRDREAEEPQHLLLRGGYGGYGCRGWVVGAWAPPPPPWPSTPWARWSWTSSTPRRRRLMFRGIATDELSDKPEKNAKKLAKASDKMFKDFPPGSKKK